MSDLISNINLNQSNLIEASAGTGKTYSLTELVVRLLVEEKIPLEQILVVTFTEASTQDLRDKVRRKLKEKFKSSDSSKEAKILLDQAIKNFEQSSIETIHSFCLKVLKENAFETGLSLGTQLITDSSSIIAEITADFWASETYPLARPYIEFLQANRFFSSQLIKLYKHRENHPKGQLYPHKQYTSPPDLAAYEALFNRTKASWAKGNKALEEFLTKNKPDGRKYQDRYMENRIFKVDQFFNNSRLQTSKLPSELQYFQASNYFEWSKKEMPEPPELMYELDEFEKEFVEITEALTKWLYGLLCRYVDFTQTESKLKKELREEVDFNDLLSLFVAALEGPQGPNLISILQKRFHAALIDEFQDTDKGQYFIFNSIFGEGRLFMIGDPKQSIYSFRGADMGAYLKASANVANKTHLDTNYRSDPKLVQALNYLYQRAEKPFLIPEIESKVLNFRDQVKDRFPSSCKLLYWPLSNQPTHGRAKNSNQIQSAYGDEAVPKLVAAEVLDLLSSKTKTEPKDIAILTRNNKQVLAIQRELEKWGVPVSAQTDQSLLLLNETEELLLILKAMLEPHNLKFIKNALSTSLMGLAAQEIYELNFDQQALGVWMEKFQLWSEVWEAQGIYKASRLWVEELNCKVKLLGQKRGETQLGYLNQILTLLATKEQAQMFNPYELLNWLEQEKVENPKAYEAQPVVGGSAVAILTAHKSKGLEFSIVICPYLGTAKDENLRHLEAFYKEGEEEITIPLTLEILEGFKAELETQRLSEDLRLLYVALTRAKHKLIMLLSPIGQYQRSAFAYLLFFQASPFTVVSEFQKSLKDMGPDDLKHQVLGLCEASQGLIEFAEVTENIDLTTWEPAQIQNQNFAALELKSKVDQSHKITSFSALTRFAGHADKALWENREEDPETLLSFPIGETAEVVLKDFPKGAKAGNFFHELFENIGFSSFSIETSNELINSTLGRYQFSEELNPTVNQAVTDILSTPLKTDIGAITLKALPQDQIFAELDFIFPILKDLTPSKLASVISLHEEALGPFFKGYGALVEELNFMKLKGFLKGFIDLTFVHEGKYFIADYKTNFLGDQFKDYSSEKIAESMMEHHYPLQLILYQLAIHRLLTLKIQDYSFATHMGGAFYLYLRGMHPGQNTGVYFTADTEALVMELDSLMKGEL
ncbi:MAG: exodeoxyribonuclease V subunit beta [SAR324 cluster bacterium]|nr:exodeoxyribonuclease V subunit beta [SAR324 cluster bacterium]